MNDTTTTAPQNGYQLSTKVILIALGVFVLIAAALYFVGMTQGRSELAAQKTNYEQQLTQGSEAMAKSTAELADARNHSYLMQAQVALYRTAIDLDQRNFGIASTRLHDASEALGAIGEGSSDIDLTKTSALKDSIDSSDFTVAADLETQRARVLAFAAELDAITAGAN